MCSECEGLVNDGKSADIMDRDLAWVLIRGHADCLLLHFVGCTLAVGSRVSIFRSALIKLL